jgi:hypothetical protein
MYIFRYKMLSAYRLPCRRQRSCLTSHRHHQPQHSGYQRSSTPPRELVSSPSATPPLSSASTPGSTRKASTSTWHHHLHRLHTRRGRRLPRHGVTIFVNSSSDEDVFYIGATGLRHDDVAIFFDLSPGEDADCTGTQPFFYTNRLHQAEVISVTATP